MIITYDKAGDKVVIQPDAPLAPPPEEYTRADIEAKIAEYNNEISYFQSQITPWSEKIAASTANRESYQVWLNGLNAAV